MVFQWRSVVWRKRRLSWKKAKQQEVRWYPFQLNPEMPVEGLDRRLYRSAKFGSWEQSQRLDAQVSAAGTEVGIRFRHDLMKRTPNTFRGHVLLAAALKDGLQTQNLVAERLFQAYFLNGEDVGDPTTLLGIAREFGVTAISQLEDLDSPATPHASEVKNRGSAKPHPPAFGGFLKSRFKEQSLPTVLRKKSCSRTRYGRFWKRLATARTGDLHGLTESIIE